MKPNIHLVAFLWANTALASSVSTLFSLPTNHSWLENLAIRQPAGDTILATRLDIPQLWSIDITTGQGTLLANATSSVALVGIAQLPPSFSCSSEEEEEEEEVYYIAGVNYTATGVQANSSVLYSLTYHNHNHNNHSSSPGYTFQKALALPQMTLINGLTSLSPTTLLATDSYQAAIYKIDISTGTASILIQDPDTMGTDFTSAGINGVKVLHPPNSRCDDGYDNEDDDDTSEDAKTYIYYTNTNKALVARIAVDPGTGVPLSNTTAPEILTSGNALLGAPDDFALLNDGSLFVATGSTNTVVHVSLDGNVTTIAGSQGDLQLASSTACQLGWDGKVLYVTTASGEEGAVNGTLYGPGSVVAVEL